MLLLTDPIGDDRAEGTISDAEHQLTAEQEDHHWSNGAGSAPNRGATGMLHVQCPGGRPSVIPTSSARLIGSFEALDSLAGGVVPLVESVAEQGDEVWHLVGGEPEGADADVVAPEREDHDLPLLVPGRAKRAAISAGVGEDCPGAGNAGQGHESLSPRPQGSTRLRSCQRKLVGVLEMTAFEAQATIVTDTPYPLGGMSGRSS